MHRYIASQSVGVLVRKSIVVKEIKHGAYKLTLVLQYMYIANRIAKSSQRSLPFEISTITLPGKSVHAVLLEWVAAGRDHHPVSHTAGSLCEG